MLRKIIYCPLCREHGHRKRLLEADQNAKGSVWIWCKGCKTEIKIDLESQ